MDESSNDRLSHRFVDAECRHHCLRYHKSSCIRKAPPYSSTVQYASSSNNDNVSQHA